MTDYAGAIDFPAHPTNIMGPPNWPKGFAIHTPEEPADDYPATPHWFAQEHPDRAGSTHYFVSYMGEVFQCVSEGSAAIANGVLGKPYPAWADPAISLNRQTLSVEVEGYAADIEETLIVGSAQWNALVKLVRDRCEHYGIPLDREHIIGHYEVANNRSDPGAGFPWDALIAELQEDDMAAERVWCIDRAQTWIVGKFGAAPVAYPVDDAIWAALYGKHTRAMTGAELDALVVK